MPSFLRFEIVFRMRVLSEEDIGGRRGCRVFREKVPDAGQNLRGLPGSERARNEIVLHINHDDSGLHGHLHLL